MPRLLGDTIVDPRLAFRPRLGFLREEQRAPVPLLWGRLIAIACRCGARRCRWEAAAHPNPRSGAREW